MRLIYLFKGLRRSFAFLRSLVSLVRMCIGRGYSSLVGVVCCQVDVCDKLITPLEDSYWFHMCVSLILRNLLISKVRVLGPKWVVVLRGGCTHFSFIAYRYHAETEG